MAAGALGASFARAAFGDSAPAAVAATTLSDGFFHFTGAGSNVLAVVGPDSVLMVDGGAPEYSAELLKAVKEKAGGKPVKTLFTTHWHPDHTGANETLGASGAKIISHVYTKQWMSTEIDWSWQKTIFEPAPKAALPNETFYTSGKMMFGSEPAEYAHLPQAHTDGDIYVYFPGPNILMTGDVVAAASYPILDYTTGGWLTGMVNAQKALLQIANADTRIIPGSGPAQTRADLQALNEMCSAVRDRMVKMLKQGMGPKDMLAAKPTQEFDAKYGDPELFVLNGYRGLWGHVRELGGIV